MTTAQPRSSSDWRVEIASGPNAGAVVTLPAGRYRFGQHRDNDIVLADDAVAGCHAVIEIDGGMAVIEPLAPGAMVRRRLVPLGASRRLRPGADIVLGGTRLRLHGPDPRRPWARGPLLATGLAAIAATALAMAPARTAATPPANLLARNRSDAAAARAGVLQPDTPQPGETQHGAAGFGSSTRQNADVVPPAPSHAADSLRARLAEAGLGNAVQVTAADGAVLAIGALLPGDRDRWLAAQMWFDAANQGRVALVDKVGVARAENLPHLDVGAVSAGAVPFVITGSGERYTEGSVLEGGWSIAHIGADRVTLRNGARTMDITL